MVDRLGSVLPNSRRSSPQQWQTWYSRPLVDLGEHGGERLRGIFSPLYDEATVDRYIHGQFREHAQAYAEKYTAIEYFRGLLTDAFGRIGWQVPRRGEFAILDLGSGAGNSIFPLLQLCPDALVIASDLSLDLLVVLKHALGAQGVQQRCALLQLNAEELDFAPRCVDLVVGAAVLHHLLSPDAALEGCARMLKRGGTAVFFEPFENGHAMLGLMYKAILEHAQRATLLPEVRALLHGLTAEYALRKGREKSVQRFQQVEDKWLFTRHYFSEVAERAGFSHCTIYPLHAAERQFERQTEVNLRLGAGLDRNALPPWAWEIIQHYDNVFSADLKQDLLIEGGIILRT
jgi:ubiquinone/menaquinone biosynthesis C-methylase UbiE